MVAWIKSKLSDFIWTCIECDASRNKYLKYFSLVSSNAMNIFSIIHYSIQGEIMPTILLHAPPPWIWCLTSMQYNCEIGDYKVYSSGAKNFNQGMHFCYLICFTLIMKNSSNFSHYWLLILMEGILGIDQGKKDVKFLRNDCSHTSWLLQINYYVTKMQVHGSQWFHI